jgi:hypothetical protein
MLKDFICCRSSGAAPDSSHQRFQSLFISTPANLKPMVRSVAVTQGRWEMFLRATAVLLAL